MVDYRRGFAAIRKDPKWKSKLGLGILISLIPYVGAVWRLGWEMEYERSVAWGEDDRLPEWSDFSAQALLGLKGFVAVLPYSLVIGAVMTPIILVPSLALFSAAGPSPLALGAAMGAGFLIEVLVLVGATLLILPFTGSAILRTSLYGTFEAAFQLGEIRRLMRENRGELRRAWGYSAANTGLLYTAMLAYFGLLALLAVVLPGSWEQKALPVFGIALGGYLVYIVVVLTVSFFVGLAQMHYFGSYGRTAYGLDKRSSYLGSASSTIDTAQ